MHSHPHVLTTFGGETISSRFRNIGAPLSTHTEQEGQVHLEMIVSPPLQELALAILIN